MFLFMPLLTKLRLKGSIVRYKHDAPMALNLQPDYFTFASE
jgi:hypothetical protein